MKGWRGNWKCATGLGAGSGHVRFLSEKQLQVARRLVMVGWCCVVDGVAGLLGNAMQIAKRLIMVG